MSEREPLMQLDFIIELFTPAKARGIHTAVDTSVCTLSTNEVILNKWKELLKVCDLFICDIKEIDSVWHKALTRLGNKNILQGIKWLDDYVSALATDYTDPYCLQGIKTIFTYLPAAYHNGSSAVKAP